MNPRSTLWWLAATVAALLPPGAAAAGEPALVWQPGQLLVRTAAVELVWRQGAIVELRDRRSGETFADGRPGQPAGEVPRGSSPVDDTSQFAHPQGQAQPPARDKSLRLMPGADSAYSFRKLGDDRAEIAVEKLANGRPGDRLVYRFSIDRQSGEVLLQVAAHADPSSQPPLVVDLPLVGCTGAGAILGSGAQYLRGEPPQWETAVRPANNLSSPRMAVIEGRRGCLAVWADRPDEPGGVLLAHDRDCDQVILRGQRSPLAEDRTRLESTTFRLGAYPAWTDAARRYRALFAQRTGARPLWENRCAWVRSIHAVCMDLPPQPAEAEDYYTRLGAAVDPARLLLLYWNGSGIVLFGDHRYMTKLGRPRPEVIAALKQHGFRWLGYHPYLLVYAPQAMPARLEECRSRGDLPEGYQFTPDYDGPPEHFPECFRDVAAGYYRPLDEAQLWVVHPGSRLGREYLVRNLSDYCRCHQMDGVYLDTLGAAHDSLYADETRVCEGLDHRRGETQALADLARHDPQLPPMSEVQSEWTVAHTFYTWEGQSHFSLPRVHPSIQARLNHPLRTALWGSYCWTRDEDLEPDESALIGALPRMRPEDPWSVARARLFAQEELYNDLPPAWDPAALAYYRAAGGRWFQYRRMPWGEGFVQCAADGPQLRLGVLAGQSRCPLDPPLHIPGWIAYEDGRPIGLDPARRYPFLLESPPADAPAVITQLPPDVYLRAIRGGPGYRLVELGSAAAEPRDVEIGVQFAERCLRAVTADEETAGPWEAGQAARLKLRVPGGLVLVTQEPMALKGPKLDRIQASGRILDRGTADGSWCFNSSIYRRAETVAGRELPAVHVAAGRFRGHADFWIRIPAGAALKFETAYAVGTEKGRTPPRAQRIAVQVNGREIWSEPAAPHGAWQAREIPLAAFAGRTVLITLTAELTDDVRRKPTPDDRPVLFGDVRLEAPR